MESLEKFQVGLFPQDLRELFEVIDAKDLRSAGIIRNASASPFKIHDLVLPIRDVYGNYVAMAGRTLLEEKVRNSKGIPKYKNSIYKKSHHLFGLNFAKRNILETDVAYVVEGYFDVITPHQKGIKNIVATCGTFLSMRHLAVLSRYTKNIVVIMDNEELAQERAAKILEKRGRAEINLSMANPLQGKKEKDIDEFLRFHSADDLLNCL